MPKRHILILDNEESPWPTFLSEFFADTLAAITICDKAGDAGKHLSEVPPDVLFILDDLLTPTLIQKIKVLRDTHLDLRVFALTMQSAIPRVFSPRIDYDGVFREPISFLEFQDQLAHFLPCPDLIRLLMVEDEPEVVRGVEKYFSTQTLARIDMTVACNGAEGLIKLQEFQPDIIITDVKMPVMSGQQFYAELKKVNCPVPVIVFFDAIFGDEIIELRKVGNPAIVEKGAQQSSIPHLVSLMLKMIYFA